MPFFSFLIVLLSRCFFCFCSNKLITQTDLSADHLQWPSFHNGVATGLRVVHHSSQVFTHSLYVSFALFSFSHFFIEFINSFPNWSTTVRLEGNGIHFEVFVG